MLSVVARLSFGQLVAGNMGWPEALTSAAFAGALAAVLWGAGAYLDPQGARVTRA